MNDDERIARALQEEYDREQQQQQSSQQPSRRQRRAQSATTGTTTTHNGTQRGSSSSRRHLQASAPPEAVVRGDPPVGTSDEEYARRLAQEEAQLYQYYQQRQQSSSSQQPVLHHHSAPPRMPDNYPVQTATVPAEMTVKRTQSHDNTSQESSSILELEDEEYARRLEQELRDEQVARQMQAADERRASRHEARRVASEPAPRYSFKCFMGYTLCFTVVGAAVVAFIYYFYIAENDGPSWIWDPEDFANEDPFDAKGPDDVTPWRTQGRGLSMEVINALDEEWHEFFYAAILDWDTGYPDTLSLATDTSVPDSRCSRIDGKVKVCNGDYGATSWKGINEIQIDRSGYIFASTCRLNDYYFDGNKGSMQYTMCHELGHAWGLPHTDEIFGNPDLGNCMDYTHNEDENKHPDLSNYDFLYQLYGLVPGAEPYSPPTPAPTFDSIGDGSSQQIAPAPSVAGNNGVRWLDEEWNDDVMEASITDARERIMSGEQEGVRLLHKSSHGELHEADLAYGHRLRIHKLFSRENDV